MGCMRSSKLEDGRSFHLRKRVHASATPPMEAATATITVRVVLVTLLSLGSFAAPTVLAPVLAEGSALSVAVTILVAV